LTWRRALLTALGVWLLVCVGLLVATAIEGG
jgi:hypothetical protein